MAEEIKNENTEAEPEKEVKEEVKPSFDFMPTTEIKEEVKPTTVVETNVNMKPEQATVVESPFNIKPEPTVQNNNIPNKTEGYNKDYVSDDQFFDDFFSDDE